MWRLAHRSASVRAFHRVTDRTWMTNTPEFMVSRESLKATLWFKTSRKGGGGGYVLRLWRHPPEPRFSFLKRTRSVAAALMHSLSCLRVRAPRGAFDVLSGALLGRRRAARAQAARGFKQKPGEDVDVNSHLCLSPFRISQPRCVAWCRVRVCLCSLHNLKRFCFRSWHSHLRNLSRPTFIFTPSFFVKSFIKGMTWTRIFTALGSYNPQVKEW